MVWNVSVFIIKTLLNCSNKKTDFKLHIVMRRLDILLINSTYLSTYTKYYSGTFLTSFGTAHFFYKPKPNLYVLDRILPF